MKNLVAGLVMGLSLVLVVGWNGAGTHAGDDPEETTKSLEVHDLPTNVDPRVISAFEGSEEHARHTEIGRAMQQIVSRVNVDSVTAEDFIGYFADYTGLNVSANWSALEAADIKRDKEVRLSLHGVTVERVLQTLCASLEGQDTSVTYEIADGIVIISTAEDLSRRTVVRLYDVWDLVSWIPGSDKASVDLVVESLCRHLGAQGVRQALVDGWNPHAVRIVDTSDSLEHLVEIIRQTIDPESWREAGGNVGAIQTYRHCLVVTQTTMAHRQIEQLLNALRRMRDLRAG